MHYGCAHLPRQARRQDHRRLPVLHQHATFCPPCMQLGDVRRQRAAAAAAAAVVAAAGRSMPAGYSPALTLGHARAWQWMRRTPYPLSCVRQCGVPACTPPGSSCSVWAMAACSTDLQGALGMHNAGSNAGCSARQSVLGSSPEAETPAVKQFRVTSPAR